MRCRFLILVIVLVASIVATSCSTAAQSTFQADSVLLKHAIRFNGSLTGQIKITNTDKITKRFSLTAINLGDFVGIEPASFDLPPGDTRSVSILFSNPKHLPEGVYAGTLEISTLNEKAKIPVILEIESDDVLFDSNIALFPTTMIYQGDKINTEIKIFDLARIGTASLEATYFIKNFNGKTIVSESEDLVVKDQVLITKTFDLPKNLAEGDYILSVTLRYKNSVGTSSAFFRVETKKTGALSAFLNSNSTYFATFLLVIFVLLFSLLYLLFSRDKLLQELKSMYSTHLRKEKKYLREKEEETERLLKTKAEKELSRKLFRRVRRQRAIELKKIHAERVKKLRRLRRLKQKTAMVEQIAAWKKKGYETRFLEERIKPLSAKEIRKQMQKWKNRGYKIPISE